MKIKNVKVAFLNESICRSGYPMQTEEPYDMEFNNGLKSDSLSESSIIRAKKLANTSVGSGHNNFLKGIIVQFDLQYPEYFSPQLQRYHWIDIVSSQSKMHKITSRELTKNDFTEDTLNESIILINDLIKQYNQIGVMENTQKILFKRIISNLPSGYLKWMGISTNYLQLKTIYNQRCKHKHKLEDWVEFGKFIESLPMSELITGKND